MVGMTRALFTAFFFSLVSQAAIGSSVFYCSGNNTTVIENCKLTNYTPENFKFSIDDFGEEKLTVHRYQIRFGSDGYLANQIASVTIWRGEETWFADMGVATIAFNKGSFGFTVPYANEKTIGVRVITANCDKF